MNKLIQRLIAELKQDKRRTAILAALLGVALVLCVRMVLIGRPRPVSATAAPALTSPAQESPFTPKGSLAAKAGESRGGGRPVEIDTTIKRDLFIPPEKYFPSAGTGRKPTEVVSGGSEAAKASVWKEASTMTLESTILSSSPKAIIDGQLLQIGDELRGFRLEEVSSRSVTLTKDGVSVSLEMKGD